MLSTFYSYTIPPQPMQAESYYRDSQSGHWHLISVLSLSWVCGRPFDKLRASSRLRKATVVTLGSQERGPKLGRTVRRRRRLSLSLFYSGGLPPVRKGGRLSELQSLELDAVVMRCVTRTSTRKTPSPYFALSLFFSRKSRLCTYTSASTKCSTWNILSGRSLRVTGLDARPSSFEAHDAIRARHAWARANACLAAAMVC